MVVDKLRTLLFDCDDTLYPHNEVSPRVRTNITRFIETRLSLPSEKAGKLTRELFLEYGTTLRGLQQKYHVDANEYWRFVHGSLPYDTLLQPDLKMARLLSSIDRDRFRSMYVFTNADHEHAMCCLRALKIPVEVFDGVIDVRSMDFHNKPEENAYRIALQIAGENDADKAILFDDSHRNVVGAHEYGLNAVHVVMRPEDKKTKLVYQPPFHGLPHSIDSLHDLPRALPFLFEAETVTVAA